MKRKNLIAVLLTAAMTMTMLGGCGSTGDKTVKAETTEATEGTESADTEAGTEKEGGKLRVGMECAYAPFNWTQDEPTTPNGSKAVPIYNKFIGDWGGESREYKFEAIKDGKVVKTVTKAAVTKAHIDAKPSHTLLTEVHTYDVSHIRIKIADQNDNQLYFFNQPVSFEVDGPFEIIGPKVVSPMGGATGVYVKSIGEDGDGKLTIKSDGLEPVEICLSAECF